MEYLPQPQPTLTLNVACSQVWLWDAESCACSWVDVLAKFGFDLNWLQFFQVSSKILINDKKPLPLLYHISLVKLRVTVKGSKTL